MITVPRAGLGESVSDEHTLMVLPGRAVAGTLPCWESAQIQDRWPLRRDSEETTRLTVKKENSARGGGGGEEHRGPTGKRCRKPMGGVEETETEQRLEGEAT